ncbi:hypothetical protein JYT44_02520 [Caldithrix abyssi]|nr:hypothetical protein [Caldithrix abyssi]
MAQSIITEEEIIRIEDLQTEFLSLKVGEEIPELQIKRIRKIINPTKQDNLPGVDYKYIIETEDNKILKVGTWILWKKIKAALRNAGKIEAVLHLDHPAVEEYVVSVV